MSHLGGGSSHINAWIKVWRLPSLLPEHQDLWLHLGLCIPHSFSARGHLQEPTFLRLDSMCEDCRLPVMVREDTLLLKRYTTQGFSHTAAVTNGTPRVLCSGALPQGSQMLLSPRCLEQAASLL